MTRQEREAQAMRHLAVRSMSYIERMSTTGHGRWQVMAVRHSKAGLECAEFVEASPLEAIERAVAWIRVVQPGWGEVGKH